MQTFIIFVAFVCVLLVIAATAMAFRISRVGKLRMSMLDDIFEFADWKWRLEKFHQVDFKTMVWKWWRPVKAESFYSSTQFLTHR